MSFDLRFGHAVFRWGVILAVTVGGLLGSTQSAVAQRNNLNTSRGVGGVSVDPAGMLDNLTIADRAAWRRELEDIVAAIPEGLDESSAMRVVSLRQLDATLRACQSEQRPIPDEVALLGGLRQIRYVLVYPEKHDIVLVGPAEPWKVSATGEMVGTETGLPMMHLDDLLVAMRSAAVPQPTIVSCSIDPTQEGLQRVRAHVAKLRTIGNPQRTAAGIEQTLGPQLISVTGVPETSRFARVMVAADFRMKRISMGLEPSPVRGLTSFIHMVQSGGSGASNMLPRWWLAPDYDAVTRDTEGLTFELPDGKVKTMTETEFVDAQGNRHQTGRAGLLNQRWAKMMTDHYEELSRVEPVFGQLRNCIDLAVVGALIVRQDLLTKADLELPALLGPEGVPTVEAPAAKQVASRAALAHRGREWTIACGGVQINPWEIAQNIETNDQVARVRQDIKLPEGDSFWAD